MASRLATVFNNVDFRRTLMAAIPTFRQRSVRAGITPFFGGTMSYLERPPDTGPMDDRFGLQQSAPRRQPLLVVVEDGDAVTSTLLPICDFLDIGVERIPSETELGGILRDFCPMGVVAELDCRGQDGCHVMITIANYDRTLPIMLVTGPEPALAGAADAIEEVWRLESVLKVPTIPGVGELVNFIFKAGRKGRCMRMLPV